MKYSTKVKVKYPKKLREKYPNEVRNVGKNAAMYVAMINTGKFTIRQVKGMLKTISLDEAYAWYRRDMFFDKNDHPCKYIFKALQKSEKAQKKIAQYFCCNQEEIAFGDVYFGGRDSFLKQKGDIVLYNREKECPYKIVLGAADFEKSHTNLGNLRFVGGYADFQADEPIVDLNNVKVGGRVFLSDKQEEMFSDKIEKRKDGYFYLKPQETEKEAE